MTVYKFLSPEWVTEVQKMVNSTVTPETVKYATTSVLTVFENCPGNVEKALFTEIEKGVFTKIALQSEPYPATEFVISGEYSVFLLVFKGQLEPTSAIMTGKLKLKGNMFKAMGMVSTLAPFYTALAKVPSEY